MVQLRPVFGKALRLLAVCLALTAASTATTTPFSTTETNSFPDNTRSLVVSTSEGKLEGRFDPAEGLATFWGIPFAEPPVGALRWQPPQPRTPWEGVRPALDPGPACMQNAVYANVNQSEDCLRLHVWTKNLNPAATKSRTTADTHSSFVTSSASADSPNFGAALPLRPVIVWLHGGGLVEGSSFSIQSGLGSVTNITGNNDAVVVGVEYRLGVAGFLALDALRTRDIRGGGCVGNYGLLDVVEALRWVQRNAAAFGGDPGRVTVVGQSSGGSLVFALVASPAVTHAGLLHGGISLSGSPRLNSTTTEAATYWHQEVVQRTRCAPLMKSNDTAALGRCLLALNATELVQATPDNWHTDGFGFSVFATDFQYAPILLIDHNCTLPRSYYDAFQNETVKVSPAATPFPQTPRPLPLIIGATRQESDFSPQDDVRGFSSEQFSAFVRTKLEAFNASFIQELLEEYMGDPQGEPFDPQRLYSDIVTDSTILCPNAYLAARWTHSSDDAAPVYFYAARQRTEQPFCALEPFNAFSPPYCPLYSFHASDMFMWFGPRNHGAAFNYTMTARDQAFGAVVQSRFAEFAATGRVKAWEPFTLSGSFVEDQLPQNFSTVDLVLPDAVVPRLRASKCDFWLRHRFYEEHGLIN